MQRSNFFTPSPLPPPPPPPPLPGCLGYLQLDHCPAGDSIIAVVLPTADGSLISNQRQRERDADRERERERRVASELSLLNLFLTVRYIHLFISADALSPLAPESARLGDVWPSECGPVWQPHPCQPASQSAQ